MKGGVGQLPFCELVPVGSTQVEYKYTTSQFTELYRVLLTGSTKQNGDAEHILSYYPRCVLVKASFLEQTLLILY